jgi:hypothetical protein
VLNAWSPLDTGFEVTQTGAHASDLHSASMEVLDVPWPERKEFFSL